MAGAVDDPLLEKYVPARVGVKCAAVGMPAGHPTVVVLVCRPVIAPALNCATT